MGFFNKLFGSSESDDEEQKVPWILLSTLDQLEAIKKKSFSKPQVIFKHSTSCGISRMVLNMFTSTFNVEEGKMDFYFLDLLAYREVSNEIASVFDTYHQSPQLLIIKDGVVVEHASHGAIDDVDLTRFVL